MRRPGMGVELSLSVIKSFIVVCAVLEGGQLAECVHDARACVRSMGSVPNPGEPNGPPELAVQRVEARVAAVRALAAVVQELAGTGGGGGGGTSLTQGSNCAIVSGALLGAMDDYTTDNRWGRLFEVQGKGRLGSCCAPAWTAGGRRQFQRRDSLAYCSAANAVMQRLRCAGCRPPLCAL